MRITQAQTRSSLPREEAWRDPNAVARTCLAAAVAREVARVTVEVLGERAFIALDRDGWDEPIGALPRALGERVIVRLEVLAGITSRRRTEAFGRVTVAMDPERPPATVLVEAGAGLEGPRVELRRIEGAASPWLPRCGDSDAPRRLGAYTLLGELGRGGGGVVYRGVHDSLGREAAIKVLGEYASSRAESAAAFLREARLTSRLDHPAIVRVHDFGVGPGERPYLVMERLRGPTLREVLDDEEAGALAPRRVVRVGAGVAGALAAAHREGVIHCDVKPDNVFLLEGDAIKVADFGAAQLRDAARRGLNVVGTPGYMAPELFRAAPASPSTDLYALGCSLFELVTGQLPFDHAHLPRLAIAHQTDPVPPIESPLGAVDPRLADVIRRCLAKSADDRPADAAWVAGALEELA